MGHRGYNRSERQLIRGTSTSAIDGRLKLARSDAGQAEPAVAPSQEAIRSAIASGICAWCKRGPYKMLAGHVNQQHGIDRLELRALAGLTKRDSICDPDFAATRSDFARRHDFGSHGVRPKPGRVLNYSEAGLARRRANGAAMDPQVRSDAGKKGGKIGGRIRGEQLRKERQPCAVCGGPIAYSPGYPGRKTCSPECLRTVKAANMQAQRARGRRNA